MAFYLQLRQLGLFFVLLVIAGAHGKRCMKPAVRREWRSLSRPERADWINAVKCLTKLPHDNSLSPSVDPALSEISPVNTTSSFYDDIVYLHMDLNLKIHFTGFFLPWHRAYLWAVEQQMKTKCGYKGTQPYWDWTRDAADFAHTTILDDDPTSGLGGWGDPNDDIQIKTGGFSKDFMLAYPTPHRIRRSLTLQPFTERGDFTLINTTFTRSTISRMEKDFDGDFVGFQAVLESGPHAGPHLILGGDMRGVCTGDAVDCNQGPKWSPNDPLFFLHHAMVDKVWYDWQQRNTSNFYAFHGGSVTTFNDDALGDQYPNGAPPFLDFNSTMPNDGMLWNDLTIWDVMDPREENLCYIYA